MTSGIRLPGATLLGELYPHLDTRGDWRDDLRQIDRIDSRGAAGLGEFGGGQNYRCSLQILMVLINII
jgi:hypothetical protein